MLIDSGLCARQGSEPRRLSDGMTQHKRREFRSRSSAALMGLGLGAASASLASSPKMASSVSHLKKPAAIGMWGFSWLLRHCPGGEFENWDAVIGGQLKHGHRFNCSSNFTNPQFPRHWNAIAWHRRVTAKIRGAAAR